MFYDSASCAAISSLYICHVTNILGYVPMMPCIMGGQYATHHPLSLPYSTGPCRMGRRYEARRQQRQPPLPAQPVDVALRPGQERKVSILNAKEARAKTVREERARADGQAPADDR